MYIVKEVNLNPKEEDKILGEVKTLNEIPFLLEELGFKDCKTKLNEQGTRLYYKGKRALYVHYEHNGSQR